MLTKPQYLANAEQLAKLLCIMPNEICVRQIKLRLISRFNNTIFGNYFLLNLGIARFYSVYFGPILKSGDRKKRSVKIWDIVTNQYFSFLADNIPNDKVDDARYLLDRISEYFSANNQYGSSWKVHYLGTVKRNVVLQVDVPTFDRYNLSLQWDAVSKSIVSGGAGWSFLGGGLRFPDIMDFTWAELIEVQRINLEVEREKAAMEGRPPEDTEDTEDENKSKNVLLAALAVAAYFLIG